MRRNLILFSITIIILFVIVSIVYFKPIPENYVIWVITALTFLLVIIIYAFRGGALPSTLITKYLPLPLALISPSSTELKKLFETHILPATQAVVELTETEAREKAYTIIKHIREFFYKELKGTNLGDTEAVRRKLAAMKLYSNINDDNERKNFQYSLASLINWISRYRNLVMHAIDPDPVDAWFALRTTLIYIRDRYPLKEAVLYTKCPNCGTINKIRLHDNRVHWLQEITMQCKECGNSYRVKITPELIAKHHQIADSLSGINNI